MHRAVCACTNIDHTYIWALQSVNKISLMDGLLQMLQDVNKYKSIAWVLHEIMLTEINSMEHDINAYTEGNIVFFKYIF